MIKKILIANRGEIALRVISTCKEMGIKTVSIYSHYDESLPHALLSDESVLLEGDSLGETYLNIEKIIEIAKDSGADAIHPGYGFLSENTEFTTAIKKAGLIFIGPSESAIKLMGDKKESKIYLEKINSSLIPGYHGDKQDEKSLKVEAKKIGYPILIKATAGGGGKGMRIVESESTFSDLLASAKREALNAFGNDQVLLEKFITNPRHIEVQVMSDSHGQHFHFFERECSIQRRYQKIIEETPSVALDAKMRAKICQAAVDIAKKIDYIGAGTIEFILDDKGDFYFLEMNTRLQVEHPITEMVTGYDLVKLQIQVANGDKLNIKQENIKQSGHALECRIYAEDPDNGFLPTNGTIEKIGESWLKGIRLDCGYCDGNAVSTQFDPMLAKLIVFSSTRIEAINKMKLALIDYSFLGVKTNRNYLTRVLNNTSFLKGNITTNFVIEHATELKFKLSDEEAAHLIAGHYLATNKKITSTASGDSSQVDAWTELNEFRNI